MSERFRIYLSYILICTIWGSTWLVIKIGLEIIPPLFGAGLRFLIASALLLVLIKTRGVNIPWDKRAKRLYLIVALTSFSVPFALVYWGEQFIPSGLTSILFAVYPFMVALFSFMSLKDERITAVKVIGIILGFTGIVVVFSNDIGANNPNAFSGMAAILVSAVFQAFSVIVIKKMAHETHPFAITFVPMIYSSVILLTAAVLVEDVIHIQWTTKAVLSIFYLGIFGSVVTFVSYFWLLKRVEAVLLSLTAFITPIVAIILGVFLLDERFSSKLFLGAMLVLGGIIIANREDLRKKVLAGKK
jgi:drug/metabolite transporter (DMT)-like permease